MVDAIVSGTITQAQIRTRSGAPENSCRAVNPFHRPHLPDLPDLPDDFSGQVPLSQVADPVPHPR
jgi:hypothetical protein